MPWTLSHPAAVLPLRRLVRGHSTLPRFVVGSMTPDIGYYIDRFDLSDFAHTLPGSFIACLPTGVIMLFFFYLFFGPVCYTLPSPHRQSLLPLCPDFPTGLTPWVIILLSLLIGAWTHNFWDAFTHETWLVCRSHPVVATAGHATAAPTVHVYLVLQEGSTVVGFVIVVLAYWLWLRRSQRVLLLPPKPTDGVTCFGSRSSRCRLSFPCRRPFTTRRRRLCTTFALVARLFSALPFIPRT